MKTRAQAVDEFRHSISGVLLDLLFREARGAELSLTVRQGLRKIDELAGKFYDELVPPQPLPAKVPANGQAVAGKIGQGKP
jgi:hypothetical protein